MSEPLVMYTVYDHPRDEPDWYVVRRWTSTAKSFDMEEIVLKVKTLEEVNRWAGERCLGFMARHPNDDPCIVGVWL